MFESSGMIKSIFRRAVSDMQAEMRRRRHVTWLDISTEHIVMTPTKKERGHTTIRMERIRQGAVDSRSVMHVAGGHHKGIVINKETQSEANGEANSAELSLEFKVFLTNATNNLHTQEARQLRFWFRPEVTDAEQMHCVQDFFKELVSPTEFPRDYVGFIKKIMKLMQITYTQIKKIEVEMRQLEETSAPPTRPTMPNGILISVGPPTDELASNVSVPSNGFQNRSKESAVSMYDSMVEIRVQLTPEKVLELIESAYPNPLNITDMAKSCQASEDEVHAHLKELESKGLIKSLESGTFTRVTQNDTEVKLVRQMPTVNRSQQPTIAIITAQYCEKLAVDAMIDNKDTYVRYKTEGESNVYTLGNIGVHRVVSTKLPAVGHSRGAIIAAGNTTTRLLGTFQKVEYIFLVGLGGGVPHYTDYLKHVRLGDVVVSCPPDPVKQNYIYLYCEKQKNSPTETSNGTNGKEQFNVRSWVPPQMELQDLAKSLWKRGLDSPNDRKWEHFIKEGSLALRDQEADFGRPPAETDKLFMSIGGKDMIEVNHPALPESDPRNHGMPWVHFGGVGSGRTLMREDALRNELASQYGILAFDTEFDAVAESVFGNRKDNYVFIRGIADYKDGTRKKEWQANAALAAAAFMKALICAVDPCEEE